MRQTTLRFKHTILMAHYIIRWLNTLNSSIHLWHILLKRFYVSGNHISYSRVNLFLWYDEDFRSLYGHFFVEP